MKAHKDFGILLAAALFLAPAVEAQEERSLRESFMGEASMSDEPLRTRGGPAEGAGVAEAAIAPTGEAAAAPIPLAGKGQDTMFASGDGKKMQDDIGSLGPLFLEQPKTKPFYITPATKDEQYSPAVAFDGTNYLVVWINSGSEYDSKTKINKGVMTLMGARVTEGGKVLDPKGFPIHVGDVGYFPRVAFGKDPKTGKGVYLVVWQGTGFQNTPNVRGALVSTDGKVSVSFIEEIGYTDPKTKEYKPWHLDQKLTGKKAVESDGMYIFPDIKGNLNPYQEYKPLAAYTSPDVAFNGKEFVVSCAYGYADVVARLVDPATGNVKRDKQKNVIYPWGKPETIKIGSTKLYCRWARIASGGGGQCVVSWVEGPYSTGWAPGPGWNQGPGVANLWAARLTFAGSGWKAGTPQKVSALAEAPYGHCELDADGAGGALLVWHDYSLAKKKKQKPYDSWAPDLFKSGVASPAVKPMDIVKLGWGPLYIKKDYNSYYPRVAFGGNGSYVIIWTDVTKDLVFHHPKLGCLKSIVVGAYVSSDGKPLEHFLVDPEDGAHASVGDLCFGKNEGLLVYERGSIGGKDTKPPRVLRARFLAKTKFQSVQLLLDEKMLEAEPKEEKLSPDVGAKDSLWDTEKATGDFEMRSGDSARDTGDESADRASAEEAEVIREEEEDRESDSPSPGSREPFLGEPVPTERKR